MLVLTLLLQFCAASPTPDPTACNKYLFDNCRDEHDSGNHTLCVRCTSEHTAGEKAADCTVKEVTDFCENAPKPPPADKCHTALENLCGIDIDPHACTECTVKNKAPLAAAGCTEQEEIQVGYCNLPFVLLCSTRDSKLIVACFASPDM